MHAQFRTYRLNEAGQQKAEYIAQAYDELLSSKLERVVPEGYQLGLCRNLLEQACFFAKKGMAMAPENRVDSQGAEEGSTSPDPIESAPGGEPSKPLPRPLDTRSRPRRAEGRVGQWRDAGASLGS
jgi:hypothetical protein